MARKRRPSTKSIKVEAQNYRTTILALHIFAGFLKQNEKTARHSIGRRMTTSDNNLVSKRNDQTPDLVVQVSETEGYVCEAKMTMSNDKEGWDEHVQQLQKYDDDLEGWWTHDSKLKNESNTVLLIDAEKSIKLKKHIESLIKANGLLFRQPIAFVGFIQQSTNTNEEALLFSLDWGKIYNRKLHDELEVRKRIELESYVAFLDRWKFYDAQPPVEHTMEVLWQHLFNDLKTSVDYDEKTKSWPIEINVQSITLEMQKLYGQQPQEPREVSFPQVKWIRNALEHFEVLQLAKKKDFDNYVVSFKRLKGELLERFSKSRRLMEQKLEKKRQMELQLSVSNNPKKSESGTGKTETANPLNLK